jgi:hypothetical protein
LNPCDELIKQSHGLPELPKRRFLFASLLLLSGAESWANSPHKSHKQSSLITIPSGLKHL